MEFQPHGTSNQEAQPEPRALSRAEASVHLQELRESGAVKPAGIHQLGLGRIPDTDTYCIKIAVDPEQYSTECIDYIAEHFGGLQVRIEDGSEPIRPLDAGTGAAE